MCECVILPDACPVRISLAKLMINIIGADIFNPHINGLTAQMLAVLRSSDFGVICLAARPAHDMNRLAPYRPDAF